MSQLFDYVAWFQDPAREPEDQNYEWPAVFVVEAGNAEDAKSWGDHKALAYAQASGQTLLSSVAEMLDRLIGDDERTFRVDDTAGDPFT